MKKKLTNKQVKICKKMLDKKYLGVRDRKHTQEFFNEIVRNLHSIGSFKEILIIRDHGRRHYTGFSNLVFSHFLFSHEISRRS